MNYFLKKTLMGKRINVRQFQIFLLSISRSSIKITVYTKVS